MIIAQGSFMPLPPVVGGEGIVILVVCPAVRVGRVM